MIFLTTGTQLPYDRLLKAVDEIFPFLNQKEIVCQALPGSYKPNNFNIVPSFAPNEFLSILLESNLVVSHAGMGTIITCLLNEKPLIVLPRRKRFNEHRNDHQVHTLSRMKDFNFLIASNEIELQNLLKEEIIVFEKFKPKLSHFASSDLIDSLNEFITRK